MFESARENKGYKKEKIRGMCFEETGFIRRGVREASRLLEGGIKILKSTWIHPLVGSCSVADLLAE